MGDQGYGLHPPTVATHSRNEVKSFNEPWAVEICMGPYGGGRQSFAGCEGSAQGMETQTNRLINMESSHSDETRLADAIRAGKELGIHNAVISADLP